MARRVGHRDERTAAVLLCWAPEGRVLPTLALGSWDVAEVCGVGTVTARMWLREAEEAGLVRQMADRLWRLTDAGRAALDQQKGGGGAG